MEKIMDGLDSFLQSVAYKFPKGYPDINDPKDKKMLFEMISLLTEEEEKKKKPTKKELIDLINSSDISDNMLIRLTSIIGNLGSTEPIEAYLEKKAKESNISDEQIEKFQKLLRQLDIQKEFAEYIKSPVSLDLDKSNFASLIPGIPKDKLLTLYRNMVTTIEGNVSIGPGEILFSILFDNVRKRESKGDLDVGGKNVEVKGSLGALKNAGKEKSGEAGAIIAKGYGRGSWSSTRTTGKFEEFVKSLNMEEENELDSLKLLTKSLKWPLKVASIYDIFTKDENFNKQRFIDEFEQVLKRIYHKSSFIPKGEYFDLSSYFDEQDFNSKQFEIGLSKELISQYKEYEGFDGMLYLNRAGDMKYIPSDDDEFFNQIGKSVVIKSFSDDVPRLLYVPSSN